mgnify:CR=1 FL=1
MSRSRARLAAVTGSLALSATMLLAPTAVAQDAGPEATLTDFASAVTTLDVATMPTFFCDEQAGALGGIGLADLTAGAPAGFDFMLDAISIGMEFDTLDVLSQTETEAVVDVAGTMSIDFDLEALMPMLTAMAEAFGADEEELAQMQEELMAEVPPAETVDIAGEVTLVPGETRAWVICSDLSGLMAGVMGLGPTEPAATDDGTGDTGS